MSLHALSDVEHTCSKETMIPSWSLREQLSEHIKPFLMQLVQRKKHLVHKTRTEKLARLNCICFGPSRSINYETANMALRGVQETFKPSKGFEVAKRQVFWTFSSVNTFHEHLRTNQKLVGLYAHLFHGMCLQHCQLDVSLECQTPSGWIFVHQCLEKNTQSDCHECQMTQSTSMAIAVSTAPHTRAFTPFMFLHLSTGSL